MTYAYDSDEAYKQLVHLVLKVEGGYVNDPKDKGGPTNWGIAWNKNTALLKELGFVNPTDIKNLTREQALQIYYKKYWLMCGADRLAQKSLRLAYIHFDTCVNSGPGTAAKLYFRLSKSPAGFEGGGKNLLLWRDLFLEYVGLRADFFTHCETWPEHGRGWIRQRIAALIVMAMELAY